MFLAVSSGGAIRGARGAADPPPDSRFVTYGTPVHQVVNICNIFIMAIHFDIGDELAIAQQLIS